MTNHAIYQQQTVNCHVLGNDVYHDHAQMVEAPKRASGDKRVNKKLYEFPNKISCVDF